MKEVIIVAGANGSGKTTFAKDFVQEKAYYFVNADEIGATLEGQEGFQLKAGRIFFEKIKELVNAGQSFVMESTLSGGVLDPDCLAVAEVCVFDQNCVCISGKPRKLHRKS